MSYCFDCRQRTSAVRCEAFPDGIPHPILASEVGHDRPYLGDRGIRYAPGDPDELTAAGGSVTLPVAGSHEEKLMPWTVRPDHPECSGFAVVNDDSGEVEGCHDTKAKAEAQQRALYANTKEEDAAVTTTTAAEAEVQVEELAKGKPFPPKGKSEDDDCPPGQVWDPDAEECVDDGGEGMTVEDGETLGGKPNPGTPKDGRKKGRMGPEKRRKKSTSATTESKIEALGDGKVQGFAVMEGVPTGDGREFARESLTWADPPLPLTYQPPTHGGEPGPAIDVGVITEGWRDEENPRIHRFRGQVDMDDPDAADVYRKIKEGFLKGVSVDVDDIDPYTDVELVWPESAELGEDDDGEPDDLAKMFMPPSKRIFHKGRIRGAAVLSMPAFVEAQLWAEGAEPPPLPDLEQVEQAARAEQEAKEKEREAVTAAAHIVTRLDNFRPDAAFFANPNLGQRCPVTVTDNLQVYGHAWRQGECHIGYGGECVTPPEEEDFPFFTTGEVVCAGGERIAVGQITIGTGHAPLRMGQRAAAEHYDNTGAVVADVAIGMDRIGAWIAGSIRPGATEQQVYALRASGQVSGDWRNIGGRLRLVALLGVNVPGFPVPRAEARVAGGQVQALVAAGMLDVGPRVDWEAEIKQRALRSIQDEALAAFDDD